MVEEVTEGAAREVDITTTEISIIVQIINKVGIISSTKSLTIISIRISSRNKDNTSIKGNLTKNPNKCLFLLIIISFLRYPQAAYDQSQQLHENRNLSSVPIKPANSPIMHTGRSQYEPHSTTSDPIENYEPPPPGFETLTKEEAEENFQYYQQAKKAEDDKPKVDTSEPPGTEMEGKKFIGDEENLHKHKNRSRSKDKVRVDS